MPHLKKINYFMNQLSIFSRSEFYIKMLEIVRSQYIFGAKFKLTVDFTVIESGIFLGFTISHCH